VPGRKRCKFSSLQHFSWEILPGENQRRWGIFHVNLTKPRSVRLRFQNNNHWPRLEFWCGTLSAGRRQIVASCFCSEIVAKGGQPCVATIKVGEVFSNVGGVFFVQKSGQMVGSLAWRRSRWVGDFPQEESLVEYSQAAPIRHI
jgi:hypothetical protein